MLPQGVAPERDEGQPETNKLLGAVLLRCSKKTTAFLFNFLGAGCFCFHSRVSGSAGALVGEMLVNGDLSPKGLPRDGAVMHLARIKVEQRRSAERW